MKSEIITCDMNKNGKLYKTLDIFLNDSQKDSLGVHTLCYVLIVLQKFIPLMLILDPNAGGEDFRLTKIVTKDRVCMVAKEKNKVIGILYKSKRFLSEWKDLDLPKDMIEMLSATKTKKELKSTLQKILNMKAFW